VAAAGKAEVLANGLAGDRPSGVENARHDRRVDIWNVALHCRSAIHHWHTGKADVVFERNPFAVELARSRACDLGPDVPRAVPVLLGRGAPAGKARVSHRWQLVGDAIEMAIRLERWQQSFVMR
jgi:hypothetical protein